MITSPNTRPKKGLDTLCLNGGGLCKAGGWSLGEESPRGAPDRGGHRTGPGWARGRALGNAIQVEVRGRVLRELGSEGSPADLRGVEIPGNDLEDA